MTDARSGALASPVFAGAERFVLRGAGIAGRGALRGVQAAAALAAGVAQARRILARLDAAAVVGFGGYPSVAAGAGGGESARAAAGDRAARAERGARPRQPLFVAAVPMRWRWALPARSACRRSCATVVTGNPVRPAIAALRGLPYAAPDAGAVRLLVLGGSLGARVFCDVVPAAVAQLPEALRQRLTVVQQCAAGGCRAGARATMPHSGSRPRSRTFFRRHRRAAGGGASGDRARGRLDGRGAGGGGPAGDPGAAAGCHRRSSDRERARAGAGGRRVGGAAAALHARRARRAACCAVRRPRTRCADAAAARGFGGASGGGDAAGRSGRRRRMHARRACA